MAALRRASPASTPPATRQRGWRPSRPRRHRRLYVNEILADHDGRIDIIPVAWYLPSAIDNDARMDVVPAIGANTLTPRQYQANWMAHYELERQRAGTHHPPAATTTTDHHAPERQHPPAPPRPGSCVGGSTTPIGGDWALPGPRAALDANPAAIDSPHHDYAAWDWIIPANTPIYAVRGGRVDRTTNWPYNWWSQGCGEQDGPAAPAAASASPSSTPPATAGPTATATALTVTLGDTVAAGQQILWSGNTGRSGTAHLHLEIRTGGTRRCPQPLIQSLYHDGVGLDPAHPPNERMQLLMDHPLSLDEVRDAVGHLTAALIDQQPLDDHQWDHAITTLRIAREQHGGRIRHLIHIILDAGHTHGPRSAPRRPHRAALPPRRRRRPTAHATPTPPAQPSPPTHPAAAHPTRAVRRPARRTVRRLTRTTI